jgi:hypothetical protein
MPEYIGFPIDTNPEVLSEDAFDYIEAHFPGWVPNDANLDTIMVEVGARLSAEARDVASIVPVDIFRYFGELVGVIPIEAVPASVLTTWTMINNSGYTIPSGTQVGIRIAGDVIAPFTTITETIVPPLSTVANNVLVVAVEPGGEFSTIGTVGGPVELLDTLDYVTTITQNAATSGGVDAEDDDEYLNRLRTRLQLLTPRPILSRDFAILAEDIGGVARAIALDGYNPLANEIQTVDVDATGGNFTLTFQGQTTANIAWNATAAAVQAALEALSNIAPGDVFVTGGPGPAPWTVEFLGAYDGVNVTQMTNADTLTGGAGTVTNATTRQGIGTSSFNNERMVAVVAVDEEGEAVSGPIKAEIDAYLESLREINFIVNVFDPVYSTIDVSFTATSLPGFDEALVTLAAEQAVEGWLSPANWGLVEGNIGDSTESQNWVNEQVVRYLELAQVINSTEGLDYVSSLTLAISPGTLASVDVNLPGAVPLPRPGSISGTVSAP